MALCGAIALYMARLWLYMALLWRDVARLWCDMAQYSLMWRDLSFAAPQKSKNASAAQAGRKREAVPR